MCLRRRSCSLAVIIIGRLAVLDRVGKVFSPLTPAQILKCVSFTFLKHTFSNAALKLHLS
jgi:hypothetical protein